MQPDLMEVVRQALLTGLVVLAPALVVGFAVATCVGLVQAATGLHEPLVGLVPRLVAMAAALLFTLPWILERLVDLMRATIALP